jgi:hypothetical protein
MPSPFTSPFAQAVAPSPLSKGLVPKPAPSTAPIAATVAAPSPPPAARKAVAPAPADSTLLTPAASAPPITVPVLAPAPPTPIPPTRKAEPGNNEEVKSLLAERAAIAASLQRSIAEAAALRTELVTLQVEWTRAKELCKENSMTIETRQALLAKLNSESAVNAERSELENRVRRLREENSQILHDIQLCKDSLTSLAGDDAMSVDSWLAPANAPEISPPHSPAMSMRSSNCGSPSPLRHGQMFTALYPYVGQSEDELSFAAGDVIGIVLRMFIMYVCA